MRETLLASRAHSRTLLVATFLCFLVTSRATAQSGEWVSEGPLPAPKGTMTSAALDGKVYAVTGACISTLCNENLVYDPQTNSWTARAPIPTPRFDAGGAALGGLLYVIGGCCDAQTPVFNSNVVEAYDPNTDSWSQKAPTPTRRLYAIAAAVDGIIYVAGGAINSPASPGVPYVVPTLEAYDPKTNTWTTKAPMPTPRDLATSGVIQGILYVAGGATATGLSTVLEAYNPKTDSWTEKSPMPALIFTSAASGVLDGKLYVVGATGNFPNGSPIAFAYDPQTDCWSTVPTPPTARWGAGSGVVGDTLYVFGGITANGPTAVNEAFTPFEMASIDIKPGDPTNTINLRSNGVIPVAILGSATFDPMTVDPTTVVLTAATDNGSGAPGGS
jgi:N-acetylneuraminic acid mutarotase